MKTYFLAGLDLDGRTALVVGGGDEATEKTERLLETGARVTVVSPSVTSQLRAWTDAGQITYEARSIAAETAADTVASFYFVINTVKTDPALAQAIYRACEERSILISGYDQPRASNVVMPALARSGRLRIGIATGAASPALARRLREEFEELFDARFATFLDELAAIRHSLESSRMALAERRALLVGLVQGLRLDARLVYPDWFLESDDPTTVSTATSAQSVAASTRTGGHQ